MTTAVKRIKLKPERPDSKNFLPYGQIISPKQDGGVYGEDDAQLDLTHGIPRFYIMRLEERKHLTIRNIAHHAIVTQCLGSVGAHSWYLGVAPASVVDAERIDDESRGRKIVQSPSGHYYAQPSPDEVRVFRFDGPCFVKLHAGVWHAGPFFKDDFMDFYNLELSNTNIVDNTIHVFEKEDSVIIEIDD
ncbi:hypothetical protein R1flu_003657 [Riccia fluitans]|uniref:Ureidoglycolate hydrolase n=1 Tax=Riccia fluitans TaxID=41844 RepID=A0ABD1YCP0_9MARC